MRPAAARVRRLVGVLPEGTLAVGGGLAVAGLTTYGFLVVSARALGPERYAALSVLWVLLYTVGPGLFLPLEQEVGRALAERRARSRGGLPVLRRASALGGAFVACLLVVLALGARPALRSLFDGDVWLLVAFALSLIGFWAAHLSRGALAGTRQFGRYGAQLGIEGVLRLAGCAVLAVAGVTVTGYYGVVVGVALIGSVALTAGRRALALEDGPQAEWGELSGALGLLLVGATLSQALVNAGPVAVKLLAGPDEQAVAGQLLAALVIARVPLFLFAAVQAALLPKLAGLAGSGRVGDFRSALVRLLASVAALGAVATVGSVLVGPQVVSALFGEGFALGRADLGLLAGASGVYMVGVVLAHALIALRGYREAAVGWLVGLVGFGLVTVMTEGLLRRVELGFLLGAVLALVALASALRLRLRAIDATADTDRLRDGPRRMALEP